MSETVWCETLSITYADILATETTTNGIQSCCSLYPDFNTQSYWGQIGVGMENAPWVALIGGVRWSLGLRGWSHRWWIVSGRACGWCIGRSGGGCLRSEARGRRPGWGLRLCWRLLGLLRLLRLAGREKDNGLAHNLQPLKQVPCCLAYDFVSGCLQIQSWVQVLDQQQVQRGQQGCSDRQEHWRMEHWALERCSAASPWKKSLNITTNTTNLLFQCRTP